jgi:hypothetical protein
MKFLLGAKSDGFGLVSVQSEVAASKPGLNCSEAELKSGKVRLQVVSCCGRKVECGQHVSVEIC